MHKTRRERASGAQGQGRSRDSMFFLTQLGYDKTSVEVIVSEISSPAQKF